jgi:hypothetical protein
MTNTAIAPTSFNTAQLEILQLFAEGVNEKELTLLRQVLIDFKFSYVTTLADKILDEKGWTAKDLVKNAKKAKNESHLTVAEQDMKITTSQKTDDLLKTLNRPIKKTLDIDALKKAKNYKGVNRQRFNKLVKEINITEPIELLLSQLSQ